MPVITALAALFSCGQLPADTLDVFSTSPASVQMDPLLNTNTHWAGYAAETDFSNPQNGSVSAVSATWIIPTCTPSANSVGHSTTEAIWVGIDGYSDKTVEQVGTESYVLNGTTVVYAVWYEMYPAGMFQMHIGAISPGDSVTASVKYGVPNHLTDFELSLTDNRTGKSFTVYQPGATLARTSAEWIVEAPTYSGGILPLPNFGSATFTNAQATIGGTPGAIDDPAWQVTQINMVNPTWGDAMTPLALTTVGSGDSASSTFTVIQGVPEPSTLVSLAAAAAILGMRIFATRRRRFSANR